MSSLAPGGPPALRVLRSISFLLLLCAAASFAASGCGGGGGGSSSAPKATLLASDDVGGTGSSLDSGEAITLDATGRILVAGSTGTLFGGQDLVIWCFLPTGGLDTSFGTNGRVIDDGAAGGGGNDEGYGIAIDATGRILVCGSSEVSFGDNALVIWAYGIDGNPDITFGTGGVAVYDSNPVGSEEDVGYAIALDASDRIVVAGEVEGGSLDQDMAVWRFDGTGALDTTFGTNGIFTHDGAAGGSWDDVGNDLAIDAAGSIFVAGRSENNFLDDDVVIWCLDGTGSLDPTFGGTGFVVIDGTAGGADDDEALGVTVDALGAIVVGGWSTDGMGVQKMTLWRLDATGLLDPTFGGQGYVVHAPSVNKNSIIYDVAIDALGRIVAPGARLTNPASLDIDLVAVRYQPDGTRDIEARYGSGTLVNVPLAITGDPIGGAYMAGTRGDIFGNLDAALWRLAE